VLAHRDFRLFWLAQSTSVIGDNIVLVALALFVIERTGSATDLGYVLAAQTLPLVAFLLIGGVWADRLPRHRVMVATDLVRFALHALLAALIFLGRVSIWQLVVIEALFRSAEAFFRPAANGLLPQTVPEADIQPATAATNVSNNASEFVGPALAQKPGGILPFRQWGPLVRERGPRVRIPLPPGGSLLRTGFREDLQKRVFAFDTIEGIHAEIARIRDGGNISLTLFRWCGGQKPVGAGRARWGRRRVSFCSSFGEGALAYRRLVRL